MNIRNDLQSAQILGRDLQISSTAKLPSSSDSASLSIGSDRAHLSSAASLASQVASLPDVRMEKVQSLQVAITSGSYSISSSDVAHSLMNFMLGGKN